MPDLLIRDLKPATHDLLKKLAESSGRTLEAQVERILDQAAKASDVERANALADEIMTRLQGRVLPDGTGIIREIRGYDD